MSARWITALIAAGSLTLAAESASAAPGDYTIRYDWSGSGAGFAGWGAFEDPVVGTPGYQSPFYSSRLALPKLRIAPSPAADGTGDRVYPALVGTFGPHRTALVQAPGTTQIRSATFDAVDYLRATGERQFLRLAVYGDTPPGAANVYDFRPDTPPRPNAPGLYQNDILYSNVGPITVTPTGLGRSAQVWLLTSCDPSCPTVGFDAGEPRSYGEVGSVVLDLSDPEAPALTSGGALTTGTWTSAREPQSAAVTATDPGSGVRSVTAVRRRAGGSAVTVLNAPASCPSDHTTSPGPGRDAAVCPERLDASLSQSLGSLPDGEYSYSLTATDDSARTTTTGFALRLDRTRPGTVSGSGPLRSLTGRWTNRGDRASLLVRGRDSRSGIQRVELVARLASGTERLVGGADASCASGCPRAFSANLAADLGALPDGRVGLLVRAIDAAGNVTERTLGTLLLDRVAPASPIVSVRDFAGGSLLTISPGADPAPGSGVAGFTASYRRAADGRLRSLYQAAGSGQEVRGRGTRARIAARVDGPIAVRSVDRAGNTSGAFAAGQGMISCREELGKTALRRPAKIGEVRAGRDTTATFTYGEEGEKTLELAGSLTVQGVGISLSESYSNSEGIKMGKKAEAGEGYNVAVNLLLKAERLRRYENGKKTKRYCKRTVPPFRVYQVVDTAAVPISATPMPGWQHGRADCNNSARWRGKRVAVPSNSNFTKDQNKKVTFSRGLSVLGAGFKTANTYSKSSSIRYDWKNKYRSYWLCGDGGHRDAAGTPDPKTWINLFAGGDPAKGRAK